MLIRLQVFGPARTIRLCQCRLTPNISAARSRIASLASTSRTPGAMMPRGSTAANSSAALACASSSRAARTSSSSTRRFLATAGLHQRPSSAFIQGPRSAGVRAEMRLPSTTVASSTQSGPASTMSSRIAPTLVARRPLRIRAEIGTQPAWQMKAIGLFASSNARTRSSTVSERRSLSGAKPPGMTRASKSPSATCSTVVSTGTGP